MDILTIIREEIQKFNEGVGDKYAEDKWGIPDEERQFSTKGVPDANMGERVAEMWATNYRGETSQYGYIYKNPPSLSGFDADVRAIAMENGDLYVAQQDGDFIHTDIELALEKAGSGVGSDYYEFHRVGNKNEFGASDTLIHKIQDYNVDAQGVVDELNARHLQFEFSTTYYEYLRNSVNEIIGEEIQKFKEGYSSYQEKQEFEKQYQDYLKQQSRSTENGKLVGNIVDGKKNRIAVYMNPTSLKNFDAGVRAISDLDANLYVAQLDGDFIHGDFSGVLGQDVLNNQKFITWIRMGGSDIFSTSFSYEHQLSPEEFEKRRQALFNKHVFKFFETQ